jgi:hypothetical protein
MKARLTGLVAIALIALLAAAAPAGAAVKPFTTLGSAPNHSGTTIPYFSSSFTYGGVTYPYQMVGTSPFTSGATTRIANEVVPLRFVFADGSVFDAGTIVRQAIRSPIWQRAQFLSGFTQYGDAIQRAEFWRRLHPGYHVLLSQPTVMPTVTIDVPSNQGTVIPAGTTFGNHVALKRLGLVNYSWFAGRYGRIINGLHVSARTLPILLTHDVMLDFKTPAACCVGGFHSATSSRNGNGNRQVQTAMFADYGSQDVLAHVDNPNASFAEDINALSHELSEWMNDPFVDNVVPVWQSPLAPQYGCSNVLESGDPLVGVSFTVNGYHPQDEAFLSWFAHQTPSIGIRGRYTYLGTFTSPSPLC